MSRHAGLLAAATAALLASLAPVVAATAVQRAPLDPARPIYIPTHPRVTTTVRFPGPIGAPEGAVALFTEDAARAGAEYLVAWQQGEAHFALTPLKAAQLANLNVPYAGETYVLYFYPAEDPQHAVACVTLAASANGADAAAEPTVVKRQTAFPEAGAVAPTPARLLGFMDRLKLLHASQGGPELAATAQAMQLEVASSEAEGFGPEREADASRVPALNEHRLFQIVLLRAVREPRLNCVGFVCLLRNQTDQPLAFDVASFGARAGGAYFPQQLSDAPVIVNPHENAPAYFIVCLPPDSPLRADNPWRLSVDLVSPHVEPAAAPPPSPRSAEKS